MSLQIRPSAGGPGYAPYRDLAHNFIGLARVAMNGLGETEWNDLVGPYLRFTGTTEQQLGQAAEAFAKAIALCHKPDVSTPAEALEQAGFLQLPTACQLAVAAKLGETMFGMFFGCLRDALRSDEVPAGLDDLLATAAQASQKMIVKQSTDAVLAS
jgi:hypothetical protein